MQQQQQATAPSTQQHPNFRHVSQLDMPVTAGAPPSIIPH